MKIKDTESLLAYFKGCRPRVFSFMTNEEYKAMAMAYHSLFRQYDSNVVMEAAQKYMLEEEKEITPAGLKRNIEGILKLRRTQGQIDVPKLERHSDMTDEERAERLAEMKRKLRGI